MKYRCLVFYCEKVRNSLSERESNALIHEALDFYDSLRKSPSNGQGSRKAIHTIASRLCFVCHPLLRAGSVKPRNPCLFSHRGDGVSGGLSRVESG